MKNVIKIVFVIVGTLIGAGFASGREIYLFFSRYENYGKLGIILSAALTGFLIYKTLLITKNEAINNYDQLLNKMNPRYKFINNIVNITVNAFLLLSFYIMIAGFSAYINQVYKLPIYICSTVFALICYLTFRKNIEGVIKSNEILVPILVILIAYLGIKNIPFVIENNIYKTIDANGFKWLISSILYASYNSIILIPVLTNLKDCIDSKKSILKIAIFSSVIIIVLAFFIYGLLLRGNFYIKELEMPLLKITIEFGAIFKYIYGFVIIASIFTSAISTGYSFLKNVTSSKKQYNRILIIMCILGIFVSNIGFSNLVESLYPLFGALGLIQIGLIIREKI